MAGRADLDGEVALGDGAGDLDGIRRFATQLTRQPARDQRPQRQAGCHAAQHERNHEAAAGLVHAGRLLGSGLGALFLLQRQFIEHAVELVSMVARLVEQFDQLRAALLQRFARRQGQRLPHGGDVLGFNGGEAGKQLLGRRRDEQRLGLGKIDPIGFEKFRDVGLTRGALLGGRGQQEITARAAHLDQGDIGFLDV
ncbi:hypothetical protein D3C81_1377000 [compost metagenome]